jgi:endo-1,4-beta-xylanase
MKTRIFRALGLAALLAAAPALAAAQDEAPSLKEALSGYFTVGVAVPTNFVEAADRHSSLLARHFGALVPENAMKPESLQPTEGSFRFAPADKIVRFAEAKGMRVRGHTLLWHQQTSPWFFFDPANPSKDASSGLLLSRLKVHIQTVLGHYRGRVYAWDVVNEVLSDSGALRDGAGGSRWYAILGPGYIDKAFEYAHEADPAALLVINDYNLESVAAKRDAMYDLVKGMLARGVPVGAVGMQMHVSLYGPSVAEVKATIEKFASLGVKVQITEMDVSIYRGGEAEKPASPEILELQAKRYAELFALFEAEARLGRLDTVVLWGLSDEASWLNSFPVSGRANAPLLFDRDLMPKPAFRAIVAGAKQG